MRNKVSIKDCCQILDYLRVPLNGEEREKIKGNIPYYGANGVQGYINNYIFDEDLILLAEDGGNFEEYQYRPIAYRISGKSWVNNHAHILKAKSGYNQDFIFYSLVHKNIITYIKGGTRSKLNQSELKEIEINYFPEDHQCKIAKILNTADSAIERTKAAIAKYRAIKQGMMQDLFTRGIDLQTGKLRLAWKDAPHLYKETELGWIPKKWDYKPLKDLTQLITDGAHFSPEPQSEGLPIGNVKDMTPNGLDLRKCTKIKPEIFHQLERQNCAPQVGDVLLSKDGTIGKVIYFDSNVPIVLLSSIAIIRPKLLIEGSFLSHVLQSSYFDKELFKLVSGSALKRITLKDIQKIRMPYSVDKTEQSIIAKRINNIDFLIQKEQVNLTKQQSLKKGLMQDLLTGKVEVQVQN